MSILRADSIRDRAGTGAPDFPNGLTGNLTGTATTATTATSATVATNAQGLTGTPSITVTNVTGNNGTFSGDISGVNATFSGNLTVQGTTTTIDTAVTSVDSLAVDGQVTALGNCGIGTTNPLQRLHVSSTASTYIQVQNTGDSVNAYYGVDTASAWAGSSTNHPFKLHTNNTERVQITGGGTAIFKGGLAEKVNVKAQLTGANACAITDGNVILTTTNEPGNTYPNITGVHSVLTSGQGFSVTIALKTNGSGTINQFHIDGVQQTITWSGGSAPSAGSSGHDVFTFTAMKTGSGTTDYTVFGAATNYA